MRPSSPLLDSVRDQFEDYDQLAKDFTRAFLNYEPSCLQYAQLFDVSFLVGQSKQKSKLIGVKAIRYYFLIQCTFLDLSNHLFSKPMFCIYFPWKNMVTPIDWLIVRGEVKG